MKNLSMEYVRNSGEFRPVKELRFNEIITFVLENIRVKNVYTVFYVIFNLLFVSMLLSESVYGFMKDVFTFKTYISFMGWGILAGSILIIPFHEGLHALAFLLIGAKKIRFGADLKQMIFYATADNFVAGRKGFSLVALTPFVIINLACLPFALQGGPEVRLFLTVMLLLHNIMCIGDFAMLSFFMRFKDKEMYTFDDLTTKTVFFYEKIKTKKMANITLKGNPVHTIGTLPAKGSAAPDFKITKTDLSESSLSDYAGKRIVLNIFPSIDTSTCATSVRQFNSKAQSMKNTVVLCVSMDLPFAHSRFCGAEGLKEVISASVFRSPEFGKNYGVTITDGPLAGLLSRAVVIIDENKKVIYTEQVPEITQEPDYDKALAVL